MSKREIGEIRTERPKEWRWKKTHWQRYGVEWKWEGGREIEATNSSHQTWQGSWPGISQRWIRKRTQSCRVQHNNNNKHHHLILLVYTTSSSSPPAPPPHSHFYILHFSPLCYSSRISISSIWLSLPLPLSPFRSPSLYYNPTAWARTIMEYCDCSLHLDSERRRGGGETERVAERWKDKDRDGVR